MDTRARRGLLAAIVCTGFVLTLPGVFGQVIAGVEGVLFDTATAGPANNTQTFSTTEHTTVTRVDVAPEDAFETRVVVERDGAVVLDQVVASPPGSTTFDAAVAALADACSVSGPEVVSSAAVPTTKSLGDVPNGSVDTVTLQGTLGAIPDGTPIFVGPNRSEPHLVPPGIFNTNINTDTEFFVNQVFQTTVAHQATYRFVGATCAAPPEVLAAPPPRRDPPPSQASAATPVPAVPRTAG